MQNESTILVVEVMKASLLDAVEKLRCEHSELGMLTVTLITTNPGGFKHYSRRGVQVIACDYSTESIRNALKQLTVPIGAVICRGDMYVQYLRKLVPYLPDSVKVSSEKALAVATNKRLMRQAFTEHYPKITPQFVQVKTDQIPDIERLTNGLHYPVVIKPASLASSIMIQKCDNAEQLRTSLEVAFERLQVMYNQEHRSEAPEILVEEYLEGDLYSIDSYVLAPGRVFHTPLVSYIAAKQLGIDDFFLYKRTSPVDVSDQDAKDAQVAAEKAIAAAGLQYSTVHVELIRTSGGWKIIEIGPRVGRFRNTMYREAYGIDHGYNDILVHFGLEPELELKQQPRYCAAYSIYPEQEGVLERIACLEEVNDQLSSVRYTLLSAESGQAVRYARNGGHALYEVIFVNDSKTVFDTECRWFETHVKAVVTTP